MRYFDNDGNEYTKVNDNNFVEVIVPFLIMLFLLAIPFLYVYYIKIGKVDMDELTGITSIVTHYYYYLLILPVTFIPMPFLNEWTFTDYDRVNFLIKLLFSISFSALFLSFFYFIKNIINYIFNQFFGTLTFIFVFIYVPGILFFIYVFLFEVAL